MFFYKTIKNLKLLRIIVFLLIFIHSSYAFSNEKNIFEKNIDDIEKKIDIPKGLLKAIGLTESGRYLNRHKKNNLALDSKC